MGKKRKYGEIVVGADETFYVITMDNGKTSPALDTKQEIIDWLDEHFVNTENQVSAVNVRRKKRRSALLREAERKAEIATLERRLEFLHGQAPTEKVSEQETM